MLKTELLAPLLAEWREDDQEAEWVKGKLSEYGILCAAEIIWIAKMYVTPNGPAREITADKRTYLACRKKYRDLCL